MEKNLKKLSRRKLLELLVDASEKNERLAAENAALRDEVSKRSRLPQAAKVGSIAEAALQVNGYFDTAQRAADDYLREIKRLHDRLAANAAASQQAQIQIRDRQAELDAQARQQARAQEQLYRMNAQLQAQAQQLRQERERLEAQAREQLDAGLRQPLPDRQASTNVQLQDRLPRISPQTIAGDSAATGPLGQRSRRARLAEGAML